MTENEKLRGLLREARELIERGDFREGYCMCGSAVDTHTLGDGHTPCDAGEYYARQVMERIDAALSQPVEQPEVHLNPADKLPPVDCPLLIEVMDGYLVPARRTGIIENKSADMEYRLVTGETIQGRFRWTYP